MIYEAQLRYITNRERCGNVDSRYCVASTREEALEQINQYINESKPYWISGFTRVEINKLIALSEEDIVNDLNCTPYSI